ncbi:MAG TPA: protein kinase [Blastocatellia bacterium]|nr:protein kinase [Blastocatellia bacterium]
MHPEQISHYRILNKLGAGGMGEVYLAEDVSLRRKVALKLLSAEFTRNEDRLRRFEQEAQAASALNHPNILTIYAVGHQDGAHFIATEYIEGETLRHRLLRERVTVREALDIAVQVASALSASHQAGIIHRDIKPENIMIRPDGYVKVLDFGLAKLTEQPSASSDTQAPTIAKANTDPGTIMGTINYMSPEQARGRVTDARSDIFSLGVVVYEMVAGRPPFEAETASDVMSFILHKDPLPLVRFLPQTPAELERIVAKTLAKDKEERYQTTKDLLIDLKKLKQRLEVEAEMERSIAPDSISRSAYSNSSAPLSVPIPARPTEQVSQLPVRTSSSAEYIVSEIKQHKKGFVFLVAALVVAAAAALYFTGGGKAIDSMAVVPFLNTADDPNTEYLSDGIAESIIYNLSQLTDLRVIPRSSVIRYKGKEVDPQAVSRELGVRAVLTGKVVQRGNDLLVSAELVDAKENRIVWGQQFNRRLSDLLSVQQEISKEISEKLRPSLVGQEKNLSRKRYTESSEAYQSYIKGQYWLNKRSEEGFQKAIEHFNQAIEKDPGYALPYAGLSDCYALLGTYSMLAPKDSFPKAKSAAMKALAIDNQLAEAHTSLANILACYDWEFADAEREFKRAIELNPNYATAHHWYAEYLSVMGRHNEAIAEIKRAQELDPLSLIINAVSGRTFYYARRYDEAIETLNKTIQMDQRFGPAYAFLCAAYEQKNMREQAIAMAQEPVKLSPNTPVYLTILGHTYAASGKRAEAEAIIARLKELSKQQYVQPSFLALLYTGLGDNDEAIEWLEKAYSDRDDRLVFVIIDPQLDKIQSDSRVRDLARRIGLPR